MDLVMLRGAVESLGEQIYCELTHTGDGDDRPVVVLSHGAGGSHAIWFQQVVELGRHFRVITWDSRGFGNSTNHTDRPSAENAGVDIAAILDHHGAHRAHLVGQSLGGWHTSAFAVAHPSRVLSLTYADTIGGLFTDELREAMDTVDRPRYSNDGAEPLLHHPALWSETGVRDPARAFLYRAMGTLHQPPNSAIDAIRWHTNHDTIAAIAAPVMFIAGTHDGLFPARALERSAALIPGARFVEITDAGHSPYFEQPDAWNAAVLDFLLSATE